MATSRTGTSRWKHLRQQALRGAQQQGTTHCPQCGVELNYDRGRLPNSPEPDHILPHSRGGRDELDNLRVMCRRCNQSRGNRRARKTQSTATTTTTLINW